MRANVESGIAKIDVCVNVNFIAGTKFTYASLSARAVHGFVQSEGGQTKRAARAAARLLSSKLSPGAAEQNQLAALAGAERSDSIWRTADIEPLSSLMASSISARCFCRRASCFSDLSRASRNCLVLDPVGS